MVLLTTGDTKLSTSLNKTFFANQFLVVNWNPVLYENTFYKKQYNIGKYL